MLLLLLSVSLEEARAASGWELVEDQVYREVDGRELRLDVGVPHGPGPFPGLVVLHGGAWRRGEKGSVRGLLERFASRGFVTASVGYRLSPRHSFPAQVHDVKCAVRWLRAHAGRLALDPQRIAALGPSAGGHLALMLGVTRPEDGLEGSGCHDDHSSAVAAVVGLYAPTDLAASIPSGAVAQLLGAPPERVPELADRASPLFYLRRRRSDLPPLLLVHGDRDDKVPYEQARRLVAAGRASGADVRLFTVRGGGHGGFPFWNDWLVNRAVDRFLAEALER